MLASKGSSHRSTPWYLERSKVAQIASESPRRRILQGVGLGISAPPRAIAHHQHPVKTLSTPQPSHNPLCMGPLHPGIPTQVKTAQRASCLTREVCLESGRCPGCGLCGDLWSWDWDPVSFGSVEDLAWVDVGLRGLESLSFS